MNCEVKTPWAAHMDGVPMHLEYPDCSMADLVEQRAQERPDIVAFDFFGVKTTYAQLIQQIKRCAAALRAMGVEIDSLTAAQADYLGL